MASKSFEEFLNLGKNAKMRQNILKWIKNAKITPKNILEYLTEA